MMTEGALPRLIGLRTYVSDLERARAFWARHFQLALVDEGRRLRYEAEDWVWEWWPGGAFCGTRGPHHALPVFAIEDFGHARGYLLAHDIPIVFEEMVPGLNLLVFLDPDSNPFELAQETDPEAWDIAQRKALRTKRRQDAPQTSPITLQGLAELTIYAHDITASVQFYRDGVGLPVGLSYFAHVHLVAENLPVVLRTTRWQCKAPEQRHGTEPVFAVDDLDALRRRLEGVGAPIQEEDGGLVAVDPAGLRVHFRS